MYANFRQPKVRQPAKHFIYAPEGEEVEIGVYAEFTPAACTAQCAHGDRSVTWTVSGAPNYTVESADASIPYTLNVASGTFRLGDAQAGDTITVTCAIGATSPGACNEKKNGDLYEHTPNSHGGASATCTIKLWRLDMEANQDLDPLLGYPFYTFEFAKYTTTTATVIGATPVEYRWRSTIGGPLHAELTSTSNTWAGKIVASTGIDCRAMVVNACKSTQNEYAEHFIHLYPSIRRPGWTMDVSLTGADYEWQQGNEDWFPGNVDMEFFAANTNLDEDYLPFSGVVVTPVYGAENEFDPFDYGDVPVAADSFENVIDEVVSGPCINLWYNTDPSLYKVDRTVLVNYWVTPDAVAPSTPALDPDGDPYTNWLQVQADQFGDYCICSNPSGHGGNTTNIRFVFLTWHEGFGAPLSPNAVYLGHQGQLEDAILNGPRMDYDAVWRCDLQYATSPGGLLAIDEAQRAHVQANLFSRTMSVHSFVNGYWDRHNFNGNIYVYGPLTSAWESLTYTN
jgi:hypothetical protein